MSFEVHDCAAESVRLKTAILLYEGCYNPSLRYATVHPVDTPAPDQPPIIRAGRPLDQNKLREVCGALSASARIRSGLLTENVLSMGMDYVIWWSRPGSRTHFFDCKEADGVLSVGKRGGTAPTPGLIFAAKEQNLWVFAVKGNSRPTLDTPLFHAPLMNCWEDGRVCLGTMALPEDTLAASVSKWETSFWESNFSHPNHAKPVKYRGGIHKLSIDLLDGKFKDGFPERVLCPAKEATLGALMNRFDGPAA